MLGKRRSHLWESRATHQGEITKPPSLLHRKARRFSVARITERACRCLPRQRRRQNRHAGGKRGKALYSTRAIGVGQLGVGTGNGLLVINPVPFLVAGRLIIRGDGAHLVSFGWKAKMSKPTTKRTVRVTSQTVSTWPLWLPKLKPIMKITEIQPAICTPERLIRDQPKPADGTSSVETPSYTCGTGLWEDTCSPSLSRVSIRRRAHLCL